MDNEEALFPEVALSSRQHKLSVGRTVLGAYKEIHKLLDELLQGHYNKRACDEMPVLEAFKIHIETPLGTYHNFYRRKELDKFLEEHPEIDSDAIKTVAEFKNNAMMNYFFEQFTGYNLSSRSSPTYIKIFQDHLYNRKISDGIYNRINELNVENVNNSVVIQNYRDAVEDSNIINVLPKKTLKEVEAEESQARRDFENKIAIV